MNHLDIIVKDGKVTIPSIFMFEHFDEVWELINHARKMNCTLIFANENFEIAPSSDDNYTRFKVYAYTTIISNREIGNAYVRYLGSPDKMSWEKVKHYES